MPKLKIDRIGTVEVDDSFLDLSPEDQQRDVEEIVRQLGQPTPADPPKAPSHRRQKDTQGALESVLKDAFPNAIITGKGRTTQRNAQVNGAPNSYHLDGDALDVALQPGMTVASVRKAFADRGIPLTETLIHDMGSGRHLHIAWNGEGGSYQAPDHEPAPNPALAPASKASGGPVDDVVVPPVPIRKPAPTKPNASHADPNAPSWLARQGNALVDGLTDTLGAPADIARKLWNSGLEPGAVLARTIASKLGGVKDTTLPETAIGSEGIRSGLRKVGLEHDGAAWAPQSGMERFTQAGARGLGQSIIPSVGTEGLALKTGTRLLPAAAKALGREALGGIGSGMGGQVAREVAPGSAKAEALGMILGGGLASGMGGTAKALVQEARARAFVTRQATSNPHVATDAAVASDIGSVLSSLPRKGNGKALATRLTDPTALARLRALERRWLNPDVVNSTDALPSQKATMREALANPHVQTAEDLDAIRAMPGGDTVANGITNAQRLRAFIPDNVGSSNGPSMIGDAVDTLATAGGASLGGLPGAVAGRMASAAARRLVRSDPVRSTVRLAEARAKLAPQLAEAAERAASRTAGDASPLPVAPSSPPVPSAPTAEELAKQAGIRSAIRKGRDVAPEPVPDARLPVVNGNGPSPAIPTPSGPTASQGPDGRWVLDPGAAEQTPTAPQDVRDIAALQRRADAAAKAEEAKRLAGLAEDNKAVGRKNAQDNISAGGGYRGWLEEQTGLDPANQDAAALSALANGKISLAQFKAHLAKPEDLMPGGAGLALADRMKADANTGAFPRVEGWTPPQAGNPIPETGAGQGTTFIANPLAYAAAAAGNQSRVTQAIKAVGDHPLFDAGAKGSISTALAQLGGTSSRKAADAIVSATVDQLPADLQADALSILNPVAAQIKR